MTRKQYRTAMGKTVDMGALMLQNEQTRAVGNMNVNARGDKLDSGNKVIDKKSHQIKRQTKKQVRSDNVPVSTSNAALRKSNIPETPVEELIDILDESPAEETVEEVAEPLALQGGLAAAIAKAKTVQQTKLTPPKQAAKASGVKKI